MVGVTVNFDGSSTLVRGHLIGGWGFTVTGGGLDHEEHGRVERKTSENSRETNNVAEYTAAIKALEYLVRSGYSGPVDLVGDSQLVVRQMTGEYKVRASHLVPYHQSLRSLSSRFESIRYLWIPREENSRADVLSKRVLETL